MSAFQFAQPQSGPTYDPAAVQPMRDELNAVGVRDLLTPGDVDAALDKPGSTLVVINSVCGCAAGNARPGVMLALQNKVIPDQLATVFAGQEREAVQRVRERMAPVPPSSPCIALFKDGKVAFCLERRHIENQTAMMVAQGLIDAFNKNCAAAGPSIPAEEFEKIVPYAACGSGVPRMG